MQVKMINWRTCYTGKNYAFKIYRTSKGYGNIILLSEEELNFKLSKSLTNNMEEVIQHLAFVLTFGQENLKEIKFYQWCPNEGLFEIIPWWKDIPIMKKSPLKVGRTDWKFISKDLKQFEILYCG